jgi:DNA-binding NarL/FixJ family response regulator
MHVVISAEPAILARFPTWTEKVRQYRESLVLYQQARQRQLLARAELPARAPVQEDASTHLAALTPRQREIAVLIARGLTNQQIAKELVLAPGTVANHVAHILERLDVRSRIDVAVRVTAEHR